MIKDFPKSLRKALFLNAKIVIHLIMPESLILFYESDYFLSSLSNKTLTESF